MSEKLRLQAYKDLCFSKEMEFLNSDDFGIQSYLQFFDLCKNTRGKIRNLLVKKSDDILEEKYLFDYKYTVSTGKSSATFDQTVFFINSKKLGMPNLHMKPENIIHKIGALLGFEDIDFISHPVFSDRYRLTGEDENYIRHVYNDSVLNFFSKTNGWSIEACNYYLIFYSANKLIPINTLDNFFTLGETISELFYIENANK